jgi:hypothetical protein
MKNVDPGELYIEPAKLTKRRKHFVKVPFTWVEKLAGAGGQTYALALHLLYLNWKHNEAPFKLGSILQIDGIGRETKRRTLSDLERRGLIEIKRRARRSPMIRVLG